MRVAMGLVGGGQTVLDYEDYLRFKDRAWVLGPNGYVYPVDPSKPEGYSKKQGLHRWVMDHPFGLEVHHRDGCPWNNCKDNLAAVNPANHLWAHKFNEETYYKTNRQGKDLIRPGEDEDKRHEREKEKQWQQTQRSKPWKNRPIDWGKPKRIDISGCKGTKEWKRKRGLI